MASGASFNIEYAADDDVHVTVLENAADVRLGIADVRVSAGRQVSYGRKTMGVPNAVDPMEALAWREGRLVFVSAPFGRVVASLNRWRSGKLLIVSPSLVERPVTLIVDLDRIGNIPDVLKDSLPIRLVNVTPYVTLIMAA
jgi:transmembrane sensor